MIQARMTHTLDTLVRTIVNTSDQHKLEQLEEELSKALNKVRNERFKLKQANFKQMRGG